MPRKYLSSPSSFRLIALLLATTSKILLLHLGIYIMKTFFHSECLNKPVQFVTVYSCVCMLFVCMHVYICMQEEFIF